MADEKSAHDDLNKGLATIAEAIRENTTANKPRSAKELNDREDASHRIQVAGVIIAALYLGITTLLWWTTRDGIHAGQRAYMLVQSVDFAQPLAPNRPVLANVAVKNSGQTPAMHTTVGVAMALDTDEADVIAPAPHPSVIDYGAGETRTFQTTGRIAVIGRTGNSVTSTIVPSLTPEQILRVATGDLKIYVYADISYRDVFLSRWNADDSTRTCYYWLPQMNGFTACTKRAYIR